ncbi:MAG: acetyl-CoA carboxylase [Tistlia sp.]|uniref:acetyl-CoA carboxylase n=1 Tax=Tistlia sp. TaxID=3057121 RepID=UPI0034A16D29
MADQIISPLPGTFYRRPAPDQPPYKEVGDSVAKGDVVGLVEVMKSFHEVKSTVEGRIAEFLVENEGPVQAGQRLATLEG